MIHVQGCPQFLTPHLTHEGPCTEQPGYAPRVTEWPGKESEGSSVMDAMLARPKAWADRGEDRVDARLLTTLRACCLTDEAAVHQPDCPVTVTQQIADEPLAPAQGGQPTVAHEWVKVSIQGEDVVEPPRFNPTGLAAYLEKYRQDMQAFMAAIPRAQYLTSEEDAARVAEAEVDMVNHPPHYKGPAHRKCGEPLECIDVVRDKPFNVGNAIKYLWRAGAKHDHIEDLKKAVWYIQDEIARLEEQE